ncbi:hypothetical protein RRG08_064521 [Elysia crispata]|uniref:Uncharacterized protein n=1 Tax=Elysia crispata TaxID=231223 RepID=A0AAE1CTW1_9GAST|nr:hypothetical protein RRG08_064521 [Elysia crispata]
MWSRTRQLVVKEEDPHAIFLTTAYDGIPRKLDVNRRNRRFSETPQSAIALVKVYKAPDIPNGKKTDLLSCQSGQIPSAYRHYFESLPVGAEDEEAEAED